MDCSIRANVLATAKYLEHFSGDSVEQFKSCIFEQLGCNNEVEFLHKILTNIQHILTPESSTIIKNKALEIAETQTVTEFEDISKLSIYKYVQQQQKDIFSRCNEYSFLLLTQTESGV